MKKLFLLTLICVLLIGSVSASEFDNVKDYDDETNTITITNFFGLGEQIIRMQLITPHNNPVSAGKDIKVAEIKIHEFKEDYTGEEFKEIKTYFTNNLKEEIGRDIKLK